MRSLYSWFRHGYDGPSVLPFLSAASQEFESTPFHTALLTASIYEFIKKAKGVLSTRTADVLCVPLASRLWPRAEA